MLAISTGLRQQLAVLGVIFLLLRWRGNEVNRGRQKIGRQHSERSHPILRCKFPAISRRPLAAFASPHMVHDPMAKDPAPTSEDEG
jgi:hypothetical protein